MPLTHIFFIGCDVKRKLTEINAPNALDIYAHIRDQRIKINVYCDLFFSCLATSCIETMILIR